MEKMAFITERDLLEGFADSMANVIIKSIELGEEITKEFLDAHPLKPTPEFKDKFFTKITAEHVKNGPVEVGSAEKYLQNLVRNYKG